MRKIRTKHIIIRNSFRKKLFRTKTCFLFTIGPKDLPFTWSPKTTFIAKCKLTELYHLKGSIYWHFPLCCLWKRYGKWIPEHGIQESCKTLLKKIIVVALVLLIAQKTTVCEDLGSTTSSGTFREWLFWKKHISLLSVSSIEKK